jgi:bifunctional non-homologous end joining protein LigD
MVHTFTSGTLRLRFIEPQLPTLVSAPPQGRRWIHEIKHDGYRSQILIESGRVRILTRNGFDWSDRYPGIVGAAERLRCHSAIIDGEAIVQDGHGISDFNAMRSAMRWQPGRLMLYAFDLLHLDGQDLRFRSLEERRDRLRALLRKTPPSIQFSEEFVGDAAAFFRACFARGLEGIVSKHLDSAYRSGQSKNWLKTKCFTESEFVVIGMDVDAKTGAPRALLANEHCSYAGAAFVGLSGSERQRFFAELDRLACDLCAIPGLRLKGARWCQPKLRVKVRHLAGSGMLRHASIRALS